MPHLRLSDNALEDVRLLALPRGVRYLHIEALAWSNRAGADGFLPRQLLRRITDEPDPEAAVELLVRDGWWKAEGDGWRLVRWMDDQLPRDDAERHSKLNRERQQRYYWHSKGQHHLCDPKRCTAASSAGPNAPNASAPLGEKGVPHEPNAPNAAKPSLAKPSQELELGEAKLEPAIAANLPEGSGSAGAEERRNVAKTIRERPTAAEARRYQRAFRKSYGQLYPGELRESIHPSVMAIVKRDERDRPMISAAVLAANRRPRQEAPGG